MVLLKPSADESASSASNSKGIIPALTCHRWLLEQLPSLPQFDAIKIQACLALRHVCASRRCSVIYLLGFNNFGLAHDVENLYALHLFWDVFICLPLEKG